MDQTTSEAEQESQAPPEQGGVQSAEGKPWSPFSTRAARWSWGMMIVFTIIYFVVAVLTSKEFAEVAATMIAGLPLGFILGIGLIIAGLVITRIYLAKVEA